MDTGFDRGGDMDDHREQNVATAGAGQEGPRLGGTRPGPGKPPGSLGGAEDVLDAAEDATGGGDAEADDGTMARNPVTEKVLNYNRFIDETLKGLEPMTAVVWLVLFRFASDGRAWASQQTIAERMGVDPKTVMRHLKILKTKQLVRVVEKGNRAGRANTYQLGILPLGTRRKTGRSRPRKPK